MRKYTLFVSVLVHVSAVAVILGVPMLAAATLPSIYAQTVWIQTRVVPPPQLGNPDAPRTARSSAAPEGRPAVVEDPAPLTAPDTIPDDAPDARAAGDVDRDGLRRLEGAGGGEGLLEGFGSREGVPMGVGRSPEPPREPPPPRRIEQVGGRVKAPKKIHHVAPIYPPLAIVSRTEGVVVLEAVIGEDGTVRDVRVLRSVPLLDRAAIEAVRQWRFTPTVLNDEPVPVVMSVTVNFQLQ